MSLEQNADLEQFFYAANCSQSSLLQLVGVPALSLDGFCLKYVNATCGSPLPVFHHMDAYFESSHTPIYFLTFE